MGSLYSASSSFHLCVRFRVSSFAITLHSTIIEFQHSHDGEISVTLPKKKLSPYLKSFMVNPIIVPSLNETVLAPFAWRILLRGINCACSRASIFTILNAFFRGLPKDSQHVRCAKGSVTNPLAQSERQGKSQQPAHP
mmetsp:Transcript_259/g.425  ORF Transcript_259/g.425 Transcript_259/m.425 type:complete len:138 (-) Transcript_259:308-721(-)